MKNFSDFGIALPDILLPKNTDVKTWACIACDQYTQDGEYWQRVKDNVGANASTFNMILPEKYLSSSNKDERIKCIKSTMEEYLKKDIFLPAHKSFLYTERTTSYGRKRGGLIVCIDLERYEWKEGNTALIRATEKTIPERIPPRKEIRTGAALDIPHIMLLVNDPEFLLVEKVSKRVKDENVSKAYSGTLMENGGKVEGWFVPESFNAELLSGLEKIAAQNVQEDGSTFLFSVGDGNHSLATAKAVWDEYKTTLTPSERECSPVRFALVEIVNLYASGLNFEPIHRVLFNANCEDIILKFAKSLDAQILDVDSYEELVKSVSSCGAQFGFTYTSGKKSVYKCIKTKISNLEVVVFQQFVDNYISENKNVSIDFIHGSEEVNRLAKNENTLGVLMPPIVKEKFFSTISAMGTLPRKSFSLGEADEKRFYLECRKLF